MARPFCSTGEKWDKEEDLEHSNEIWEVFRDTENGDVILWIYGPNHDPDVELRMSKMGASKLALILVKAAVGDCTYNKMVDFLKES